MRLIALVCLLLLMNMPGAWADPLMGPLPQGVTDKLLQKGTFQGDDNHGCTAADIQEAKEDPMWEDSGVEPGYNACKCTSEIHYPFFSTEDAAFLKPVKDMAAHFSCKGKRIEDDKKRGLSIDLGYSIPYFSPRIVSIVFFEGYIADGAHGGWNKYAITLNRQTGHVYRLAELFDEADYPKINEFIYNALMQQDVNKSDVNREGGEFIQSPCSNNGNTKDMPVCREWVLDRDGVKILFSKYEVSCGACEPVEITVPKEFIRNADLTRELNSEK